MVLGIFKRGKKQVEEIPRVYTASAYTAVRELQLSVLATSKQAALEMLQAYVADAWVTDLADRDVGMLFDLVKAHGAKVMGQYEPRDLRFALDDETLQSRTVTEEDAALPGRVCVLAVLQRGQPAPYGHAQAVSGGPLVQPEVVTLLEAEEQDDEDNDDDDDDGCLDGLMLGAPVVDEDDLDDDDEDQEDEDN